MFRRLHTTRTVFDLKDQPIEVWDARGLSSATWSFAYDYVGTRIKTAHLTAMGTRYAIADAAGNPIWSRDARAVEVDRVFDTLSRPLTVTSNDGTGAKLRRQFTYVAYDAADPDFSSNQADNLFGPVEEARDADGLRYFTYEHRGLPTSATHSFWDQADGANAWDSSAHSMWTGTFTWDPAIPSAARSTLSNFLNLAEMGGAGTASTTVTFSTNYDSAGRPEQIDYPRSMSMRSTDNAAGLLQTQEVNRTGASWQTVIEDCRYNQRGQVTAFIHGNGVTTTRYYDADIERLTRIFKHATVDAYGEAIVQSVPCCYAAPPL